jgi:TRAP-type uncharacterized transport system fused permease subunit
VEIEENVRSRELSGFAGWVTQALLIAIPVSGMFFLLDVPQRLDWQVFHEQYIGLFLALTLAAIFLLIPGSKRQFQHIPWFDYIGAAAGLFVGLYIFVKFPEISNSLGDIYTERVILGAITVILLAEACRRLVGWPLVIIAGVFIFYALFAYLFPGDF